MQRFAQTAAWQSQVVVTYASSVSKWQVRRSAHRVSQPLSDMTLRYLGLVLDCTAKAMQHLLSRLRSAGVMACSQHLQQNDLVAVSIAMEAPGSEGCITRGSVIGPDLTASSTLYIGLLPTQPATFVVNRTPHSTAGSQNHRIRLLEN